MAPAGPKGRRSRSSSMGRCMTGARRSSSTAGPRCVVEVEPHRGQCVGESLAGTTRRLEPGRHRRPRATEVLRGGVVRRGQPTVAQCGQPGSGRGRIPSWRPTTGSPRVAPATVRASRGSCRTGPRRHPRAAAPPSRRARRRSAASARRRGRRRPRSREPTIPARDRRRPVHRTGRRGRPASWRARPARGRPGWRPW